MSERQRLLHLVLMVKDEERSISPIVKSCEGVADVVTVLDTGSTDKTVPLAMRACEEAKIDCYVHAEPFIDFGTTRTRAFQLAEEHEPNVPWLLMLSGDETLVNASVLRPFLSHLAEAAPGVEALSTELLFGKLSFTTTRICRAGRGWTWKGPVHEVLTGPHGEVAPLRVPSPFHIFHDASHRNRGSQYPRDRDLLLADWAKAPSPRTAFYLAQTYECLGDWKEADVWYERRIVLGGWEPEAFEARYRRARIAEAHKTWEEAESRYLAAYSYYPSRAEPLFRIAHHHYQTKEWKKAVHFAEAASRVPYPIHEPLFIEKDVYEMGIDDILSISAFWAKEPERGRAAMERLLARRPLDPRIRENAQYYGLSLPSPANFFPETIP